MARKLTEFEKAHNAWLRKVEKADEMSTATYSRKFVAPVFQKMIRAEAGALDACWTIAIVNGGIEDVIRTVGQCVCVTCGKVRPWSDSRGSMQTGHFLPSRRFAILFEEDNVAPQCVSCNKYRGGALEDYTVWMAAVRGTDTIDRLRRLKETSVQFTSEGLVDMRLAYEIRLKAAIARMT